MNENQKGLTVIELLLVMVVLSILASLTILTTGNIAENTHINAYHANATVLNHATRFFKTANPEDTRFQESSTPWVRPGSLHGISPTKFGCTMPSMI
ncbi:MAG: type II secretion system protein [Candidatus Izemoplasmataceae bacterium]